MDLDAKKLPDVLGDDASAFYKVRTLSTQKALCANRRIRQKTSPNISTQLPIFDNDIIKIF